MLRLSFSASILMLPTIVTLLGLSSKSDRGRRHEREMAKWTIEQKKPRIFVSIFHLVWTKLRVYYSLTFDRFSLRLGWLRIIPACLPNITGQETNPMVHIAPFHTYVHRLSAVSFAPCFLCHIHLSLRPQAALH